ncbi:MAG: DNA polymerase domain-containing protein [bacterium]
MYSSTTNLVEGLMLTRFRRNGKCAPYFAGGSQAPYEAAYVKDPIQGKYDWLFSLDITSSYPFAIITLNMSPETLYGKILNVSEQNIVKYMKRKEFPEIQIDKNGEIKTIKGKDLDIFNKCIKNKVISMSPNGVMFFNKPAGVYSTMEREIFEKRKELKRKMAEKYKEYNESGDIKTKYEANNLFTSQWALKIIINAAYGVTAVPYSRFFSPYIAEAVTSVGRYSLKSGEWFVNDIFNNPNNEIKEVLSQI